MSEIIWKTLMYQGDTYERIEVSNTGLLRNAKNKHIYKITINQRGYVQVCISLGSRKNKKVFRVHRAVAETFIQNPENKREINHIDGNKQNNLVENLEWSTHSENIQHAFDTGLNKQKIGTDNIYAKLSKDDVRYIRENYIPYDKQYGSRALGRKFGISHSHILEVINRESYISD